MVCLFVCIVSGEVPQEPVVSKTSGLLFEKRLIEKYLKEHGKCPVTGVDMVVEDLLSVQGMLFIYVHKLRLYTVMKTSKLYFYLCLCFCSFFDGYFFK
jgi:hypothetical protein